ncbi:MAG: hypothetical protein HY825_19005 [Acidobacteria bacterium]|nr:hypothetical protein [Acidobacteriota bacterium]
MMFVMAGLVWAMAVGGAVATVAEGWDPEVLVARVIVGMMTGFAALAALLMCVVSARIRWVLRIEGDSLECSRRVPLGLASRMHVAREMVERLEVVHEPDDESIQHDALVVVSRARPVAATSTSTSKSAAPRGEVTEFARWTLLKSDSERVVRFVAHEVNLHLKRQRDRHGYR